MGVIVYNGRYTIYFMSAHLGLQIGRKSIYFSVLNHVDDRRPLKDGDSLQLEMTTFIIILLIWQEALQIFCVPLIHLSQE